MVAFDQSQKLADLIRFGLTPDILQVHEFRNLRVRENMMTAGNTLQFEAEALNESGYVGERDIF